MQSGLFRCSTSVVKNDPGVLHFSSAFADLTNNLEFTGATGTHSDQRQWVISPFSKDLVIQTTEATKQRDSVWDQQLQISSVLQHCESVM